jgi:P2-related tail formation protein
LIPFGYEVTLVEWWQMEPKGIPGTFYLELDLVGRPLDESLFKEVNRLVDETKPASRRLSRLTISANPLLSFKNIVAHQSAYTSVSEPKP